MQFYIENKDGHLELPYPFDGMSASPISMEEAEKIIRNPKDYGHKIIFTGCERIA